MGHCRSAEMLAVFLVWADEYTPIIRNVSITILIRKIPRVKMTRRRKSHPYVKFILFIAVFSCVMLVVKYWFIVVPLLGVGGVLFVRHRKALGIRRQQYFQRTGYNYDAIPEAVKAEVWRRARGHCEDCGSEALLEYDHVVPRRYGGLNTARNIRLRCRPCHREKTNSENTHGMIR